MLLKISFLHNISSGISQFHLFLVFSHNMSFHSLWSINSTLYFSYIIFNTQFQITKLSYMFSRCSTDDLHLSELIPKLMCLTELSPMSSRHFKHLSTLHPQSDAQSKVKVGYQTHQNFRLFSSEEAQQTKLIVNDQLE